jgi:hypothetical protein
MKLQLARITSLSNQAFGNNKTIDETGVSMNLNHGERSDDSGTKLATVICLFQDYFVGGIKEYDCFPIIFALASIVEIKRIECST